MPSTHASFSFALTTALAYDLGMSDPIFAVSLIFSMIVCYDAMGVRFESGKQAEIINDLAEIVEKEKRHRITFEHLKEKIGHKPLEVIMGIILGSIVATIFNLYIF
jgi:acid phosphatase family membrane protein YuiD